MMPLNKKATTRKIFNFLTLRVGALLLAVATSINQAGAQTVELASRSFWLGERPKTVDLDRPFFGLRRIDWIEKILSVDPILEDVVVLVEDATGLVPLDEQIQDRIDQLTALSSERLPGSFEVAGLSVYGPKNPLARSIIYIPDVASRNFEIECALLQNNDEFLICVVLADYAPDENIRLVARLYGPPLPSEDPTFFFDVIDRMTEVVLCLDVSESDAVADIEQPQLAECRAKTKS